MADCVVKQIRSHPYDSRYEDHELLNGGAAIEGEEPCQLLTVSAHIGTCRSKTRNDLRRCSHDEHAPNNNGGRQSARAALAQSENDSHSIRTRY